MHLHIGSNLFQNYLLGTLCKGKESFLEEELTLEKVYRGKFRVRDRGIQDRGIYFCALWINIIKEYFVLNNETSYCLEEI